MLRKTLSEIKSKDTRSAHSVKIHNVELDQFESRQKIHSPIAITGVNHVHYMIEHLLLSVDRTDVNGSKPRSGKFFKRTDLNAYPFMRRLSGRDILGSALADTTTRTSFTDEAAQKLSGKFYDLYGRYIVRTFEKFRPFEIHNKATLDLKHQLEAHQDRKLQPILFGGQGIGRVFEDHRQKLGEKLDDGEFNDDAEELRTIKRRLDGTAHRIVRSIEEFQSDRATTYLNEVPKNEHQINGETSPEVIAFLNRLYENVFKTVAFQTALVSTFMEIFERSGAASSGKAEAFENYISQINKFFVPKTPTGLKRLVKVFQGEIEGSVASWKVARSNQTFREVAHKAEMQPDQWPKYKYLLLELWDPEGDLADYVTEERQHCRAQVFSSLHDRVYSDYLSEHRKLGEELTIDEQREIFDKAFNAFKGFLRNIGATEIPKEADAKKLLAPAVTGSSDSEGSEDDDAYWDASENIEGENSNDHD